MKAYASLPGIISHRNSIFGAVQNDSVIFMRMYDRTHEYMNTRESLAMQRIALQVHLQIERKRTDQI